MKCNYPVVLIASCLIILWGLVSENAKKPTIVNTTAAALPYDAQADIEENKKWTLLRDIITCESAARWEMTEIPGGWVSGPCRLKTQTYTTAANSKGYDLFNPAQNMRFCVELFEQSFNTIQRGGDSPWNGTRQCWEDRQNIRKEQARL